MMEINQFEQPAITAACFGTSTSGRIHGAVVGWLFGAVATGAPLGAGVTATRARMSKTQADLGCAIPAYVLGTTAWSPPIS